VLNTRVSLTRKEAHLYAGKLNNVVVRQLARLGANIRTACVEPRNLAARSEMLLGAMLAGQAFANAPVAAVHALAYPLGGHYHIPHGLSNALVLPHVLDYNRGENSGLAAAVYAEIAPLVFPETRAHDAEMRVTGLVEGFAALGPQLGLDTRLSAHGVAENAIPTLAADAMKQERLLVNNPREMTREAAEAIYRAAL